MSAIRVLRAGLQTTVQDLGRWGWQAYGVPVAGPMDPWAHRWANACVGNPRDAATLEITLDGPELQFQDERMVAAAGAEFELSLSGEVVATPWAFAARPGDTLRFGKRTRGSRGYLAVSGGIDTPLVFGSRSTHVRCRMGGVEGRALAAGDVLAIGRPQPQPGARAARVYPSPSDAGSVVSVRVLPGSQFDRFAGAALEVFQRSMYAVTAESDRMGFRLDGPPLDDARGGRAEVADIISEATPMGTIQVPASGQPLLLMADRQTTGGYAKIATVITADLGLAGQLAPGDSVRFEVCTAQEARGALMEREQTLMAIEAASR